MTVERIIYLDGRFVGQSDAKISVFDQGVLFGDGIFEGIRVRSVDSRIIGRGNPGPITRTIARAFCEYARSHGATIFGKE